MRLTILTNSLIALLGLMIRVVSIFFVDTNSQLVVCVTINKRNVYVSAYLASLQNAYVRT